MLLKKLGCFFVVIASALSLPANATPILSIVPTYNSVTVRSDSMTPVLYTVTNNSNRSVFNLTIDPAFGSSSSQGKIILLTNQCQGLVMPQASCQFRILIRGDAQSESFSLSPRVCAFNNAVCSQPILADRVFVTVGSIRGPSFAYVGVRTYNGSGTNYANKLVRINSKTFEIDTSAVIPIPFSADGYAAGIAVDPTGKIAYVVTDIGFPGSPGLVDIVDVAGATPAVVGTIPTGIEPTDLVVTPDNTRVYIANQTSGTLTKYNISTGVTTTIFLPAGAVPYSLATTLAGNRLLVVDSVLNQVYVLNIGIGSDSLLTIIPVGSSPKGVAISPEGAIAYVTNSGNNTISVINLATLTVIQTISGIINGPENIVFSKDGLTAYVTAYLSDQVYIINTLTHSVVNSIVVSGNPLGIAVNPEQTFYFVSSQSGAGVVDVISAVSNSLIQSIKVNGEQGTVGAFVG